MKTNKLAFFYPLKFLLAFSIVLAHLRFNDVILFGNLSELTWNGGTQCYMLMAGMLFYLCYYNKLINKEITPVKFLIHRLKNLYIIYVISILVCIILKILTHGGVQYWDILKALFFFGHTYFGKVGENHFNYPMWFLCPLFLSYIISCAIIGLTRKNKTTLYWFVLPIAYGIFAFNYNDGELLNLPIIFNARNSFYIAIFFIGIFIMKLLLEYKQASNIYIKVFCLIFAISNLILLFLKYHQCDIGIGIDDHTAIFVIWIPLIIGLYGTKINVLFDNNIFKHLNKYSIHLWVWHASYIMLLETCNWAFEQSVAYLQLGLFMIICCITYTLQLEIQKNIGGNYKWHL